MSMRFVGRMVRMKMLRMSCVIFVILLLFLGALAALLPNPNEDGKMDARRAVPYSDQSTEEHFTLIMQTYNRTDLLLKMLNHYQAVPHISCIVVVWNNVGQDPPTDIWESLGPHPVPVFFKKQSVNLMRNRLQNFPEIKTQVLGELLFPEAPFLLRLSALFFYFLIYETAADRSRWNPDVMLFKRHFCSNTGCRKWRSGSCANAISAVKPDVGSGGPEVAASLPFESGYYASCESCMRAAAINGC